MMNDHQTTYLPIRAPQLVMFILCLGLGSASFAADSYPFPSHAEDLPEGHYWWLPEEHGGGQAYDLNGTRFDGRKWVETKRGAKVDRCAKPASNEDCIIYGVPVYAMASGEVVACWRDAPDNDGPGEPQKPNTGGGGNGLFVDHGDGTMAQYSHLRPKSIPKSLCNKGGKLSAKDLGDKKDGWVRKGYYKEKSQRPKVKQGQRLGEVGNSGKSSGPHLHIQLMKFENEKKGGRLALRFRSAWVKSRDLKTDSAKDWVLLKGKTLSKPPTVILPAYFPGLLPENIVGMGIDGTNNNIFAWYRNGTVTAGTSDKLLSRRLPYEYKLPPRKTANDIVGMAVDGSNGLNFAWYRNNTVSAGSSDDLTSKREPYPYKLPKGKTANDIVGMALDDDNNLVYAWYRDGEVSAGTTDDLGKHRKPYKYTLPSGKTVNDIVGMGIDGSNNLVFAWYRDGMVSAGTTDNLASRRRPYRYILGR